MFLFVELFRFVGEQIGFEIVVFHPAGPDIESGQCTFLSILVFGTFFYFLNLRCCAYWRAALINFFVPYAALIGGRRLIEGGAYSIG